MIARDAAAENERSAKVVSDMLTEYWNENHMDAQSTWITVMPGVHISPITADPPDAAAALPLRLKPLCFEVLFCQAGTVSVIKKDGQRLSADHRSILLLSSVSSLREVRIVGPLSGILVSVDAACARESLQTICSLLGGLALDTKQVRRQMAERDGCALIHATPWSQAVFSYIEGLPPNEQGRYCALKSVELLYLLCTHKNFWGARSKAVRPDNDLAHTVIRVCAYMESHLDEKLTISNLSRRFCVAPTSLKACFRRLYGQPIHAWLQEMRMKRAEELLRTSSMPVIQVAQAVGYDGANQFSVAFKRYYGVTPRQYIKMSE